MNDKSSTDGWRSNKGRRRGARGTRRRRRDKNKRRRTERGEKKTTRDEGTTQAIVKATVKVITIEGREQGRT